MLDRKTTIKYNDALEPESTIEEEDINYTLYNSSDRTQSNDFIGIVEENDSLV
jgi:hypothetical protein